MKKKVSISLNISTYFFNNSDTYLTQTHSLTLELTSNLTPNPNLNQNFLTFKAAKKNSDEYSF